MRLTPVMQRYVLHWGEMGTRWGVNRSVAQIHALLYLASRPMPADEITETLGIARSNVSTSLRELQTWGLIHLVHVLGDRRDHFEACRDVWEMLTVIADARKRREIDPTLTMLRHCVMDFEDDRETDPEVKRKIADMLGFLEQMADWYDEMRQVPRPTLMALLKMGRRIVSVAGRISGTRSAPPGAPSGSAPSGGSPGHSEETG